MPGCLGSGVERKLGGGEVGRVCGVCECGRALPRRMMEGWGCRRRY